ncbi:MAG: hypothetical protein FJW30_17335 [Acidobacteria bacterium]|nr:hypothetical protein [Acidobacteriota bacterium]
MFRKLVEHFARRLVQPSSGESGELQGSLGAALALLAAPGAFLALGLLDKYSSLLRYFRGQRLELNSFPRAFEDGHSLLLFSMAITGFVTVWKWDRILPDVIDQLNLSPLPVSRRRIFLASLASIALVAAVFVLDVNAASMVIYPMVVAAGTSFDEFIRLFFAHATIVFFASAFTFCACFSLMGILLVAVPSRWFRAASVVARAALTALLLAMWIAGRGPSRWFQSLYAPLAGRPDLADPALVRFAIGALLVSAVVAFAGYAAGFVRGMEGRLVRDTRPLRVPAFLGRWGRTPLECAALPFAIRGLWRGESTSVLVLSALLLAIVAGLRTGPAVFVPFFAGYAVAVAIPMAFRIAVSPASSWIFRMLAQAKDDSMYRIGRRVVWLHLGVFVLAPALFFSPRVAIATAALCVILVECLLLDWRSIPFTLASQAFRHTRVLHAFLALLGLAAVPSLGIWAVARDARLAVLCLLALAVISGRRRILAETYGERAPLVFDTSEAEIVRLSL